MLIERVVRTGGRSPTSSPNSASPGRPATSGWPAGGPKAPAGLADRSSRAHRLPGTAPPPRSRRGCWRCAATASSARPGSARWSAWPASTVHAVLTRHGMHRLAWLDRPTGQVIRRYERDRPGELIHVDVKKLGRIPDGGGWRVHGRDSVEHRRARDRPRVGYDYVHAPSTTTPAWPTPRSTPTRPPPPAPRSCAAPPPASPRSASPDRTGHDRQRHGLPPRPRLAPALTDLGAQARFTRRYRPQTNGKAERFNRTLLDEWAYPRPFTSTTDRAAALPDWLHTYNHHRGHTALGGQPPITRVNNAAGHIHLAGMGRPRRRGTGRARPSPANARVSKSRGWPPSPAGLRAARRRNRAGPEPLGSAACLTKGAGHVHCGHT